jgi:hypothetical protein
MNTQVKIRISDYYGHPELYPFMAKKLFETLETAFLSGNEFALVDAGLLAQLSNDFKTAHDEKNE